MLQPAKFKTVVVKLLKCLPLGHSTDKTTFSELNIHGDVTKGLSRIGIDKPSEFQAVVLPQILEHNGDIYLLSNSGAGKTLSAAIVMLNHIDPTKNVPQVLCLLPTQEMARQTSLLVSRIGVDKGVRVCLIGSNQSVDQTSHILFAAPREALNAKHLIQFSQITLTVIDEADVVTTTTAVKDQLMMPLRHSKKLLTSNTTNKATEFMNDFKIVKHNIPIRIVHSYIRCQEVSKAVAVVNVCKTLRDVIPNAQCIVFCRERETVIHLTNFLKLADVSTNCLYSAMENEARISTMDGFVQGRFQVLVSTDLVARGINVKAVLVAVNYDLPHVPPDGKLCAVMYERRTSRATHFGSPGLAVNLINPEEEYLIKQIPYGIREIRI